MRLVADRLLTVFTVITFLTASVCPALPAAAQKGDSSTYNEILTRALDEFNIGNWREARALFRRAHQMNPNARTLRGMGMAAFEMRSYLAAVKDLKASMRDRRKPLTDEQREQVQKLIERTEAFLGEFRIAAEPAGVTLQVDGATANIDEDKILLLELGQHEIVAMASGFREQTRIITVEGGEKETLSFMLEPIVEKTPAGPVPNPAPAAPSPAPAQPAQPAQPAAEPAPSARRSPPQAQQRWDWPEEEDTGPVWAWVALGASALSAGVAGIFWAQGEQKYKSLDDKCEQWCGGEEREKAAEEIEEADRMTNLFLISSAVLAGGSIILFIVESVGGASEPEKKQAGLSLELGAGSARLSGSF